MQTPDDCQNQGVIEETAFAKVNFSLLIKGRRDDGYHELESLVGFAQFGDRLMLRPGPGFSLKSTGWFADQITGDNLVEKVGRHLLSIYGFSDFGQVEIEKRLPVAAGLGGGSADAGALVRLFQNHFNQVLDDAEIAMLGPLYGADVPVCVSSTPALMRGIGAEVHPLGSGLPSMGLLLVNPMVPVSTASVFEGMNSPVYISNEGSEEGGKLPLFDDLTDLINYMKAHPNDMKDAASRLVPEIDQVLNCFEDLPGCLMVRMAGSGASCFGIFASQEDAKAAQAILSAKQPGWWIQATASLAHS